MDDIVWATPQYLEDHFCGRHGSYLCGQTEKWFLTQLDLYGIRYDKSAWDGVFGLSDVLMQAWKRGMVR